jgi:diguanylate cyclase (GGDEF)-like protein
MYTYNVIVKRFEEYAVSLSDLNEFRYKFGEFNDTVESYLESGLSSDEETIEELSTSLNVLCENVYTEYSTSADETESSLAIAIYTNYPKYIEQIQSLIDMDDRQQAYEDYTTKYYKTGDYISKYLEKIISYKYTASGKTLESTKSITAVFRVLNIVTFVILAGIIVILFRMVFHNVIEPIQKLARQSQQIANYNFDVENIVVTTNDEVASLTHMFNHMREKLKLMFESNTKNLQMAEELLVQIQNQDNEALQSFAERQKNLNEEIFREANIDHLTNLMNKNAFLHCVDEVIKSMNPEDLCAVFVLDIDNFKSISNTLGDGADELIKYTAVEMTKTFKEFGFVARWEHDVFTAFMSDFQSEDVVHKVCSQLNTDLNIHFRHNKKYHPVSVSIGVSIDSNRHNCDDMFRVAYAEMKNVKSSGKNGYRVKNTTIARA